MRFIVSKSPSAPLYLSNIPFYTLSHVQSDSVMAAGRNTVHLREIEALSALSRISILQMKISKKRQIILKSLTFIFD